MKPLDNNTARFFNRVAIDRDFGGIADKEAEGKRIAQALGNHKTLMMGNHGVSCAGDTVAEAFEDLYFFERAAKTLMLAYAQRPAAQRAVGRDRREDGGELGNPIAGWVRRISPI